MVARTQTESGLVAFQRDGEPVESIYVQDGRRACTQALHLIAKRDHLQAGDVLSVRRADDEPADQEAAP
jgi:hypothetical protein